MCKQHQLPTPKIESNGLPPMKMSALPPRVPPLPYQLDHMTSHVTSPPSLSRKSDHTVETEPEEGKTAAEKESLKVRELQRVLSDPSNYVQIVAEKETKAGMSAELAEAVKESEIILERIDQQLLELGPFAKDTFLSPPVAPKDDPGAFPITFMPPNYLTFPQSGLDMGPLATTSVQGRSRRRGGRAPPLNQATMPLSNGKPKRNSRGSETGSASSPMASTPVELRMDLGMDGIKEMDSAASPTVAKEPPKSKWRKVGSAGSTTNMAAKPPLQSRSSSDRLQNNLQSPILDRFAVLSPPASSPLPVVSTSISTPISTKSHIGAAANSSAIIPPASDFEMQSLFSSNQWELEESPPQRERDLSSTTGTPSNQQHNHAGQQPHHQRVHQAGGSAHDRASVERGDSSLTRSISALSAEIDRHHQQVAAASRSSTNRELHDRTPTPHGADPIPRPLSRPHSHSSSPPNNSHPPPHHSRHHQPMPQHSDIHALLAFTSGSEISRHLVVSGGMTVSSRPNFSISHLTNAREAYNSSPLMTSATSVNEERAPHANSASPLSEHPRGYVQRSSESPSLSSGGLMDNENPLVDRRRRNSSTSTSSHRSGRLHSFDESVTHHHHHHQQQQQQQRSSPRTTKPPPPQSATVLHQQLGHGQAQHNIDPKQQSTSGGTETKIGATVNPYAAAALWGAASAGQFAPPGQVVDPVSSTTVPRFPFPTATAPFLPAANWIQAPGGMIAAAAPGLPPVRPAMLPFDPSSPYKAPFLSTPFLAAAAPYRYSLPSGPGLKAFPGLTGVSTGNNPASSSHPGTPTATMAMPFSQPALYPGLQSSATLSAFKSLSDANVSNCSSPPILHPQHLLGVTSGGSKEDKPLPNVTGIGGGAPSELPQMDKLPGLNMLPPPASALMAAGTNLNLVPYFGMNQMQFGIGGIQPTSIGQQAPGAVSFFNPRLSTLATAGVHTGSEGNLTVLGTSKEAARNQQRRGSAASIDMSSLPGLNESPPNQPKKGFPLRNDVTATAASTNGASPAGGKWKPVTEHSPPVSQMLFNISASPSSTPFAPSMMDSRTLPSSNPLVMTSALSQMLPLSFGTPPTHQQMRGGKGTEATGRGSPRGTPDKMKLRIHQVKNDDFKMQGKPDRRRRRWKNKGQEVITTIGIAEQDKVAMSPSTSGKQTAVQFRRVRSDTARKNSATPPSVLSPDDKDEVVDVGDSSDNNYALNMLATMSTMQQSREQKPTDNNPVKTSFASPLTISTSVPSSEPSKNALLHSPVSLAGAKSLLMLGNAKDTGKADDSSSNRTTGEVTNVESTAVDSLLQLSGVVLPNTSSAECSSGNQKELKNSADSKEDSFAAQRRETRSASYSAAEAMLMMGSTSKESEEKEENSTIVTAASGNKQSSPLEVFGNGSVQEKQQPENGATVAEERDGFVSPPKPSSLSKMSRNFSVDSEATDTDSEATLTPQSPAKRLPSYSSAEGRMESDEASSSSVGTTHSTPSRTSLKQTAVREPPPTSSPSLTAILSKPVEKRDEVPLSADTNSTLLRMALTQATREPSSPPLLAANPSTLIEKPMVDVMSNASGGLSVNPLDKNLVSEEHLDLDQHPKLQPSSISHPHSVSEVDVALPSNTPNISTSISMSKSSSDLGQDGGDVDDDSFPPSKRLRLCQDEERETSMNTVEKRRQDFEEGVMEGVDKMEDVSELNLKQTQLSETCVSPPDLQSMATRQHSTEEGKSKDIINPVESVAQTEEDIKHKSAELPSCEVDIDKEEKDLTESERHSSPPSAKATTWSAFADVAEASHDEKDQDSFMEKDCDSKMEASEATASSSPSPPSPIAPVVSENVGNKNLAKLKIDDSNLKQSSVSSLSSPPFTPDPPIEINVFEKLPPSPKSSKKLQEKNESTSKSAQPTQPDALSFSSNKVDSHQPSTTSTTTSTVNSVGVNSTSVSGAPQNRLAVSKSSMNRLQHRKHVIGHSSKLGKDGKADGKKRLRPPNDSQAKLFEVDTVSMSMSVTTTPTAPPPSHSHLPPPHPAVKEKKANNERTSREEVHQDERHSPHHTSSSVRKLKRPGHSSSKSSLSAAHKQSKHSSTSKHTHQFICINMQSRNFVLLLSSGYNGLAVQLKEFVN